MKMHRVDNHEYLGFRSPGRSISVSTEVLKDPNDSYAIANKAVKLIQSLEKPATVRFRYGGKKWKVVPVNERSLWERIKRFLNPFSVKPAAGRFERYRLEQAHLPQSRKLDEAKEVYQQGIREKRGAKGGLAAFTELASQAFQKHETFFCAGDDAVLGDFDCRIILNEGSLQLVEKSSPLFLSGTSKAAVDSWSQQYIDRYGEKKFQEMMKFYRLDFKEGLTAEHIYRGNLYAANVEMRHLKHFAHSLAKGSPLTGFEQERLAKWPEAERKLKAVGGRVQKLNAEDFNRLCKAFFPDHKELDYLLTGRRISYPITSHATIGEHKVHKPWIDQQELLEVFPLLEKAKSWESYQELLAQVVVKKHLMRIHSDVDLKLGVLIPAPPKEANGPVRYYQVKGCISNGGILSYILESPCKDPSLPVIKLYRSTARHASALHAKDTLVNDLNPLNSPGYLGIRDIDFYEKQFFNSLTVPVWVGYLECAKKAFAANESKKAEDWMQKAHRALDQQLQAKIRKPTFGELLKSHDRPLNAVFFPFASEKAHHFLKNSRKDPLRKLIKTYVRKKKELHPEQVKKDAAKLDGYLKEKQTHLSRTAPLYNQIQALRKDLKRWYIEPELPTLSLQDQTLLKIADNFSKQGAERVQGWIQMFDSYAKQEKEDIGSKKATDIHLSGHSLGGACASVAIARYLAIEGRMPLPGHECAGFFFDDPGINAEDNQQFLKFGDAHRQLFEQSNVRFSLFRRHEAGDIVPAGGGMGLGATSSEEEMEKLKGWCRYDGAVHKRKKGADHLDVAESEATHGTRFLEAVAGKDFKATPINSYQEGLFHRGSNWLLKGKELKEYRSLSNRVWKLGTPTKRGFQEHLRESLLLPLLFLRFKVARAKPEQIFPPDMLDNHGAFCKVNSK